MKVERNICGVNNAEILERRHWQKPAECEVAGFDWMHTQGENESTRTFDKSDMRIPCDFLSSILYKLLDVIK